MMLIRRFLTAVLMMSAVGLNSPLLAYSDADMDGVSDERDACPATPFDELVGPDGCPKRLGVSLHAGVGQSRGDYGGSDTIVSDTYDLSIGYRQGPWQVSVSSSYLNSGVEEPLVDVNDSQGVGDTYLSVGYTGISEAWSLSLQGVVKLPTADTDIGTGEMDTGGYATLGYYGAGIGYFATFGYMVTGDTAETTYNDMDSLTLGAGGSFSDALYLSFSGTSSEALVEGADRAVSLRGYASWRLSPSWRLSLGYSHGLSDSVADRAVNLSAGYSF